MLEESGGVIGRLLGAVVAVAGAASGLVEDATVAQGLVLVHVALPVEGTDRGTVVDNEDRGEARGGGGGACTGDI